LLESRLRYDVLSIFERQQSKQAPR
jgi:hypothetical protein